MDRIQATGILKEQGRKERWYSEVVKDGRTAESCKVLSEACMYAVKCLEGPDVSDCIDRGAIVAFFRARHGDLFSPDTVVEILEKFPGVGQGD